jgi:hypothetical protein
MIDVSTFGWSMDAAIAGAVVQGEHWLTQPKGQKASRRCLVNRIIFLDTGTYTCYVLRTLAGMEGIVLVC